MRVPLGDPRGATTRWVLPTFRAAWLASACVVALAWCGAVAAAQSPTEGVSARAGSTSGAPAEEWLLCRDDVRLMSSFAADAVVLGSAARGLRVRVLERRGETVRVELVEGWPGLRAWVSRRELGARTQRRVELSAAPVLIKEGELVCVVGAPEMDGSVLIEVDTRLGVEWTLADHPALVMRHEDTQTWRSPMRVEDLDLVAPARLAVPLSQRWLPRVDVTASIQLAMGGAALATASHPQPMVGLLEERDGWSRVAIGGHGRDVWVLGFVRGPLATSGPSEPPAVVTGAAVRCLGPSAAPASETGGRAAPGSAARATLFCRQGELPLMRVAPGVALTLRDGTTVTTPPDAFARARPVDPSNGLQRVLIASDAGVLLQGQLPSATLSVAGPTTP